MRAMRSWPRSSVPSGCAHDGPMRRAVKSISLIGTCHSSGPARIAITMATSRKLLASASRCRRKRRQASRPGEKCRARPCAGAGAAASIEGDARVEPAIEEIGDEVEDDDETGEHEGDGHHDGRVVGLD